MHEQGAWYEKRARVHRDAFLQAVRDARKDFEGFARARDVYDAYRQVQLPSGYAHVRDRSLQRYAKQLTEEGVLERVPDANEYERGHSTRFREARASASDAAPHAECDSQEASA